MDQRISFPRPDGEEAYKLLNQEYFAILQADLHYGQLKNFGAPGRMISAVPNPNEPAQKTQQPSLPRVAKKIHDCRMAFLTNFATQKLAGSMYEQCEFRASIRTIEPDEKIEDPQKKANDLACKEMEELARQENVIISFDGQVREMVKKLEEDAIELENFGRPLQDEDCTKVKMISGVVTAILEATPEERIKAANYAAYVASLG